jgi:thymidylate synthase
MSRLHNHPALSNHPEHQYLDLMREVLSVPLRPDRTGTGRRSVFGRQIRFDLAKGFPLLTTKKLPFRSIALELLWFLTGGTNAKWLEDQGVSIWKDWGDKETREMGPIYSSQWRSWHGMDAEGYLREVDQVAAVIESLRTDPYGTRHIITAWNPAELPDMALPPCHCLFQFFVENDGRLSLQLYQRSADIFLGVPFNIASYALLLTMVARTVGRQPGFFVHTFGDLHLYDNHVEQAQQQVLRDPRELPTIEVAHRYDMDSWTLGDFTLSDYAPWPHIAGRVSV